VYYKNEKSGHNVKIVAVFLSQSNKPLSELAKKQQTID
jgi:hypothetical protein